MEQLLKQYKDTRRSLTQLKDKTTKKHEREIIGSMISDCEYVIRWIEKGGEPGTVRGIERRSVYQNTKVWDPLWMQSFVSPESHGGFTKITDFERFQIEDALSTLSDRERQCFTLHYGLCFSMSQIANELAVTKASVQEYLDRADKKINDSKSNSLFLVG
ncbi:sigma factor-like helix-turn-helix DNA-binding protein [Chengkuizengella axinellae]|uniref:Sigma factor-like helix-turn-helix DNA-binding protein n=1 Tax=Chengkuizengella axinellae TaxID=3064388 RepID=A0ABT9IYX9_9BACL|nr:sigma factor-like helix-turn-helix DNA-binding protein [Chengkuizengella sp. 2205SS18-9]MDP5274004.1 sigma factor-like helix-turn-helix DNA-binding protein [Chengkuizengella sp. 2205SS18-9]